MPVSSAELELSSWEEARVLGDRAQESGEGRVRGSGRSQGE